MPAGIRTTPIPNPSPGVRPPSLASCLSDSPNSLDAYIPPDSKLSIYRRPTIAQEVQKSGNGPQLSPQVGKGSLLIGKPKPKKEATTPMTGIRFGKESEKEGTTGKTVIEFFPAMEVPEIYATTWPIPLFKVTLGDKSSKKSDKSIEEMLDLAYEHLHRKEFVECRKLSRSALNKKPNDPRALTLLSISFIFEGNPNDATPFLDLFPSETRDSHYYLSIRSVYEVARGNSATAISFLKKWIALEPQNFEATHLLCSAYRNIGMPEEGLKVLQRFKPNSIEEEASAAIMQHLLGDPGGGVEKLRKLSAKTPKNAELLGNLAFAIWGAYNDTRKFTESEKYVNEALLIDPNQSQALWVQALMISAKANSKKEHKRAAVLLEALNNRLGQLKGIRSGIAGFWVINKKNKNGLPLTFSPTQDLVSTFLANAYYLAGNYEEARPHLKTITAKKVWQTMGSPEQEEILLRLADVEESLGNKEEADQICQEVLKIAPTDEDSLYQCSQMWLLRDDYDKARPSLLKFFEKFSGSQSLNTLFRLGHLSYLGERFDEAESFSRRMIIIGPNDPRPYKTLAKIFAKKNKIPDAIAAAQQAIKLGARDSKTYMIILAAMADLGKWQEFEFLAEQAVNADPDEILLPLNIATLYWNEFVDILERHGLSSKESGVEQKMLQSSLKWLEFTRNRFKVIDNKRIFDKLLKMTWVAQNVAGRLPLDDLEKIRNWDEGAYYSIAPLALALNGKIDEALSVFSEVLGKATPGSFDFNTPNFYLLIQRGNVSGAQKLFRLFWDEPGVKRESLLNVAKTIVENPYPNHAAPFVSTLIEKLAEVQFFQNNLKEAAKLYQKATQVDSNNQQAWIGLIRTYQARKMMNVAKRLKKQYERRFGSADF